MFYQLLYISNLSTQADSLYLVDRSEHDSQHCLMHLPTLSQVSFAGLVNEDGNGFVKIVFIHNRFQHYIGRLFKSEFHFPAKKTCTCRKAHKIQKKCVKISKIRLKEVICTVPRSKARIFYRLWPFLRRRASACLTL